MRFVLFILILLGQLGLQAQNLILKKIPEENKATFQLINNDLILDSLVLNQVDYKQYYYAKINDSLYHFIYKDNASPRKGLPNHLKTHQLVLFCDDNKVHIAFENKKEHSHFPHRPIVDDGGAYFFIGNYDLGFDKLNEDKLILKQNVIKINELSPPQIDTINQIIEYQFDNVNKIFYSDYEVFNGRYEYAIRINNKTEGFKEVFFDNEVIPTNKSEEQFFSFFYKGAWFKFTGLNKIFEPFREVLLDTNKIDGITKHSKSLYEGYELKKYTEIFPVATKQFRIVDLSRKSDKDSALVFLNGSLPSDYQNRGVKALRTDNETIFFVKEYLLSCGFCEYNLSKKINNIDGLLLEYTSLNNDKESISCVLSSKTTRLKVIDKMINSLSSKDLNQNLINELKRHR